MRRIKCPNESFFDKGLRYANAGIAGIGMARSLCEAGQTVYGGLQAVGRVGAAMAPAAAAIL